MANAAINTQGGTALGKATSRILSTEPKDPAMSSQTFCGAVEIVTPCDTQAHSGALSDAERMKLAKIRRNRSQGWMPTFEEFDFLLSAVERLNR